MATVYRNASLGHQAVGPSPDGEGYTTYKEPDTRVPPKPIPVLNAISVDGVQIPEEAILHEAQNHPSANPGKALRAAAEALVVRQLLLNEARRLDLMDAGSDDDETLVRELMEREIVTPHATLEECRRFYDNNPDRFMSAPLWEARHILLSAPETDSERRSRAHTLALGICMELGRDPQNFAALALAHSDCPSRNNGGNLGQLSPGATVPEFETALKHMEAGTITPAPVATRFGYHIMALDREIVPQRLPFEVVRQRIADWLDAQAYARASAQYISILAGKAAIAGLKMGDANSPLVQ
jgi:peptidyl-prolyl cis-trans isomerase C